MKDRDGAMFDTQIFDQILEGNVDLSVIPPNMPIYVTHIQNDEIEKCPDQAQRHALLKIFREVPHKTIETESLVWDTSRWDQAKFGDGTLYEELRGGNPNHTEDALIAETSIKNNLILVTEDKTLAGRVRRKGGCVMRLQEFLGI